MIKYIFLLCLIFFISCTPQSVQVKKPRNTEQKIEFRADPIYLNWLEKQSLLRQAPEKIRIVSGSNLAWLNPTIQQSELFVKNEFFELSPAWFYTNPLHFDKIFSQTYLQSFLESRAPQSLNTLGINSIFISPLSEYNLITKLNIDDSLSTQNQNSASLSYDLSEQIANPRQYFGLQEKMIIGSEMLKPSLGFGADFILALHGVRDYPGLFMMTELPREFWDKFPSPKGEAENIVNPYILDKSEIAFLSEQNILPKAFVRDYFNSSGYALSTIIRGFDSLERRWIYRFVNNAQSAVLNYSDPSLTAQKLFSASIIQQVGILRQALIGINVSDLWGQEVLGQLDEQIDFQDLNLGEPALSALTAWNKAIHSYGAWSMLVEAFPINLIPALQNCNTDFVADTVIIPSLEQALLSGTADKLKQDFSKALDLGIDFSALWRGSPDIYQSQFLEKYFESPNSMSLAAKVAQINQNEIRQIQKILSYPEELQSNNALLKKYKMAKNIQSSFLTFMTILPGLPFLSAHDLRGIIMENETFPSYSLNENPNEKSEDNIFWHQPLEKQLLDKKSLASSLKKVFHLRQENQIGSAQIQGILKTGPEIFGVNMKNFEGENYLLLINISSKKVYTNINIQDKKIFNSAKELFINYSNKINQNNFRTNFNPWQVKFFKLS